MGSANFIALLSIFFLLQSNTAMSDFLSPLLAPIFDDVCKSVECGKGSCKASMNSTFFFECECDPGWKQSRPDDNQFFKFLPCVIPNCTLDHSCSSAEPPSTSQEKGHQANESFFDPCHWTYCGGGSCNTTSKFKHSCECQQGYDNLFNTTSFPCFKECELGMDCASLGIGISAKSNASTPTMDDSFGTNQAVGATLPWNFYWLIIATMMFLGMLQWN